jgi:hypothetical protein
MPQEDMLPKTAIDLDLDLEKVLDRVKHDLRGSECTERRDAAGQSSPDSSDLIARFTMLLLIIRDAVLSSDR